VSARFDFLADLTSNEKAPVLNASRRRVGVADAWQNDAQQAVRVTPSAHTSR
jgi:hypothetical protein